MIRVRPGCATAIRRCSSFLGVPIIFKGRLLGNLYLTDKIGAEEFSEQDEHLMTMLAAQAAIAIENANLYKQVQRLAVLEERERIAMDLHDGIIQSIYAVGLMLEYAGLMFDESPEQAHKRLQDSISGAERSHPRHPQLHPRSAPAALPEQESVGGPGRSGARLQGQHA